MEDLVRLMPMMRAKPVSIRCRGASLRRRVCRFCRSMSKIEKFPKAQRSKAMEKAVRDYKTE